MANQFDAIYRKHARAVKGWLQRWGVHRDDLEDMTHEVFLVLLRRFSDIGDLPSVERWLYGVSHHITQSYRRASRRRYPERRGGSERIESASLTDDKTPTPDILLARNELHVAVTSAVARLDRKKREAFVLTHVDELSARQVSLRVNASPHTVASRLRAARRDLQHFLQDSSLGEPST